MRINLALLIHECERECEICGKPVSKTSLCPECNRKHELELEFDDLSETIIRADNEDALLAAVTFMRVVREKFTLQE